MSKNDPTYPAPFFAQLFNLSERRIYQLAKSGVIPRGAPGEYPLLATVRGYVTFLQNNQKSNREGTSGAGDERERLAKEQADKFAIDNAVKRSELIWAQHVEDVIAAALATLASQLDGLPGRMATPLASLDDPATVRSLLLDETRRIRAAYAGQFAELGNAVRDTEPGESDSPTTAEANGERVG